MKCQRIASLALVIALMAPVLAPFSSVEAQGGTLDAYLESFTSQNFPFVLLNMRVYKDGVPLTDLGQSSFRCRENGIPQNEYFSVTAPQAGGGVRLADIVFLIDASGSMGGEIADVRNNAKAFAEGLGSSDIDFRLGLVRFGNSSGANPGMFNGGNLTGDVEVFQNWIDSLSAGGGYEPGFEALRMAVQGFNFRPGAQRVFILISDEDSDDREKQATIDLLLANDVTVHTAVDCSYGTASSDYCDDTSVRGVTGGLLFGVEGPYDQVLDEIVARTAATYVVRYRSSNPVFDGTTRNVECTVMTGTLTSSVYASYVPGAGPQIERTSETEALSQSALVAGATPTIAAVVTDQVEPFVQAVTLLYRKSGSGEPYSSEEMVPVGGDVYSAAIPSVETPGVDYYIRATDGEVSASLPSADPGESPFQIAVLPNHAPEIDHTPIAEALPKTALEVTATVSDTTNSLASVGLWWRHVGEISYDGIEMMDVGGNLFRGEIPGEQMNIDIEYYIRATDDLGVSKWTGSPDSPLYVSLRTQSGLGMTDLEAGDIVLIRTPGLEEILTRLSAAAGSYWGHSGIYTGRGTVLESVEEGVKERPFFDERFRPNEGVNDWAIVRLKKSKEAGAGERAVEYAQEQYEENEPYNIDFMFQGIGERLGIELVDQSRVCDWLKTVDSLNVPENLRCCDCVVPSRDTGECFYCHQIVWRAYMEQGIDLDSNAGLLLELCEESPGVVSSVVVRLLAVALADLTPFEHALFTAFFKFDKPCEDIPRAITGDDLYFSSEVTNLGEGGIHLDRKALLLVLSPVDIVVTDPEGRRAGVDPDTGDVIMEIPGVSYSGPDVEPETMSIPNLAGSWTVKLVGKEHGGFTFGAQIVDPDNPQASTVEGTVRPGEIIEYQVRYPEGADQPIEITKVEPVGGATLPGGPGEVLWVWVGVVALACVVVVSGSVSAWKRMT